MLNNSGWQNHGKVLFWGFDIYEMTNNWREFGLKILSWCLLAGGTKNGRFGAKKCYFAQNSDASKKVFLKGLKKGNYLIFFKPNLVHSNPMSHEKEEWTLFTTSVGFYGEAPIAPENNNYLGDCPNLTAFEAMKMHQQMRFHSLNLLECQKRQY